MYNLLYNMCTTFRRKLWNRDRLVEIDVHSKWVELFHFVLIYLLNSVEVDNYTLGNCLLCWENWFTDVVVIFQYILFKGKNFKAFFSSLLICSERMKAVPTAANTVFPKHQTLIFTFTCVSIRNWSSSEQSVSFANSTLKQSYE